MSNVGSLSIGTCNKKFDIKNLLLLSYNCEGLRFHYDEKNICGDDNSYRHDD